MAGTTGQSQPQIFLMCIAHITHVEKDKASIEWPWLTFGSQWLSCRCPWPEPSLSYITDFIVSYIWSYVMTAVLNLLTQVGKPGGIYFMYLNLFSNKHIWIWFLGIRLCPIVIILKVLGGYDQIIDSYSYLACAYSSIFFLKWTVGASIFINSITIIDGFMTINFVNFSTEKTFYTYWHSEWLKFSKFYPKATSFASKHSLHLGLRSYSLTKKAKYWNDHYMAAANLINDSLRTDETNQLWFMFTDVGEEANWFSFTGGVWNSK